VHIKLKFIVVDQGGEEGMNTKGMTKTNLWGSLRIWDDNIKMDLQEVGWEGMDWIDLAQDSDRWRKLYMP
jgi:hypothetical protein